MSLSLIAVIKKVVDNGKWVGYGGFMAEYQISEETKNKLKTKQLQKIIPLIIFSLVTGMIISFIQIGDLTMFSKIIIPMIVFVSVSVVIGIFLGLKMLKKNHLDITVKIDDESISIIRGGKAIIKLEKDEIIKIEEAYDNTLIIFNKKHPKKIFIKNQYQDFNELYNDLNKLKQIERTNKKTKMNKNTIYILSFLFLIIYGIFLISSAKEIVIILGIIVVIIMVVSLVLILLNKFVDRKLKIFSLVILLIIYEAIEKIMKVI